MRMESGARGSPHQPLTWFEFILNPDLLQKHLNALKSGEARQPSGIELVSVFLDQANSSIEKNEQMSSGQVQSIRYFIRSCFEY